tara:strand:- start:681 stop:1070 length:390 start_codon:yes stop_codon:yes gene_type:complete
MKQVLPEGFELADEPQPWVLRYPGISLAVVTAMLSIGGIAFGTWIDERQRPQFEEIQAAMAKQSQEAREASAKQSRDAQQLATFQLEAYRYGTAVWSLIAESANVKMPPMPKVLGRAEDRVRDIQEGAN